ncbi:thioredoxin O, mitochondrial-like [Malus sylvestris]|uniref:thioredoxin O, mitochondrial-like n=1 Tax=Malus sylvestris TaxID=3752 RepID=UPI0021AC0A2C|nr:thioredoxin O, mitochondrial-like [Malus sylvestris]
MACLYTFTNWPIYIFVVLGSSCIFALNPKQSTESREENGEELRSSQGTTIAASSAQRFFIVTTFLPILSKPWLLQSTPHHLRHPQQLLPPPNPSPIPSITSQTLTFSNSGLSPRPQVPLILLSFRLRMNLAAQSAKLKMELCQHFSISLQCGRFISPIIGELSEQYPHVTTYKVDIDEPTFQFFKTGRRWLKLLVLMLLA